MNAPQSKPIRLKLVVLVMLTKKIVRKYKHSGSLATEN